LTEEEDNYIIRKREEESEMDKNWVALLMKSYSVEPNLVDVLQISGLLTAVAGITLIIAYVVGKKTLIPV